MPDGRFPFRIRFGKSALVRGRCGTDEVTTSALSRKFGGYDALVTAEERMVSEIRSWSSDSFRSSQITQHQKNDRKQSFPVIS
jgi:hypothetical protein